MYNIHLHALCPSGGQGVILMSAGDLRRPQDPSRMKVTVRVCPRVEPSNRRTGVDPRDRVPFVGLDL